VRLRGVLAAVVSAAQLAVLRTAHAPWHRCPRGMAASGKCWPSCERAPIRYRWHGTWAGAVASGLLFCLVHMLLLMY